MAGDAAGVAAGSESLEDVPGGLAGSGVPDCSVEVEDQVPGLAEDVVEPGVRRWRLALGVFGGGLAGAGCLDDGDELVQERGGCCDGGGGFGGVGSAGGVGDGGSGLAGDDHSGGHVPGLVAEGDGSVQAPCGGPGEVECGGAEHADTVHAGREADSGGELGLIAAGRFVAGGVVADGDDGFAEC